MSSMNTRIVQKHDTSENWAKAVNFAPLEGEIIVYTDLNRLKVGDGETNVNDLPFENEINLEPGTGKKSVQQIADGVAGGIAFDGENPNAQALDETLAQVQFYGAIGDFSSAFGGKSSAQGKRSHAEGTTTIAKGGYSHAEGNNSVTLGANSHAEGRMTVALGENSHSEGYNTQAQGDHSHAEGVDTITIGAGAHAEGGTSIANGDYAHAEGETARALSWAAHAEGLRTLASNAAAHAEGADTQATAAAAHAEGGGTQATAQYSHAEGVNTLAQGDESHAEGMATIAYAPASHAEGNNTRAIADHSHAEGNATEAEGINSHAEGSQTAARAWASHAEGEATKALGNDSHAEGLRSEARGYCSHAGGEDTIAEASHSFASGFHLVTAKTAQAVVGRGNVSDPDAMFVVGAADFDEEQWQMGNHRNSFTTGFDGTESYVTVGGVKLTESKLLYLISLDEKIGDIESALDAILEMQESLLPPAAPIYFTVDWGGVLYNFDAVEGMTWRQWCNSEYNTEGAYVTDWNTIYLGVVSVKLNGIEVNPDDQILDGGYYAT